MTGLSEVEIINKDLGELIIGSGVVRAELPESGLGERSTVEEFAGGWSMLLPVCQREGGDPGYDMRLEFQRLA